MRTIIKERVPILGWRLRGQSDSNPIKVFRKKVISSTAGGTAGVAWEEVSTAYAHAPVSDKLYCTSTSRKLRARIRTHILPGEEDHTYRVELVEDTLPFGGSADIAPAGNKLAYSETFPLGSGVLQELSEGTTTRLEWMDSFITRAKASPGWDSVKYPPSETNRLAQQWVSWA